jgi:putative transposase
VNDIFMACVDELKGFPETIEAIYLHTEVQLCIVHLVRASLNYVPWKHRKLVAADLRRDLSCGHGGGSQAQSGGGNSEVERLSQRQPSVEWNWDRIFHYPAKIRKAIYTTNCVGTLIARCARSSKHGELFPTRCQR